MRSSLFSLVLLCCSAAALGQTRPSLPPAEADAKKTLDASPRHGEWADVKVGEKTIRCWVVYPEVKDKAPVVIVIQEIFGLSDWLRATTDQFAAEGFIAVAPDLLSGKGPNGGGTESFASRDDVVKAVRDLDPDSVTKMLDATADFGRALPAANQKLASVGFCWGGGASFAFATHRHDLSAAVVCYGTPPTDRKGLADIACPVLGLYGGNDSRVSSTVPGAESAMKQAGKTYTPHISTGPATAFSASRTDVTAPISRPRSRAGRS